jgi:hypothetical protein
MWEKQIEARRSVTVAATPGQAWPLLSGPAAWCLHPGAGFAFDVAASPAGCGHLFLWISGLGGAVNSASRWRTCGRSWRTGHRNLAQVSRWPPSRP